MSDKCKISILTIEAQARMFRLAQRDYGLTRKVLSLETGISYSTLKSWESGTEMPISGFVRLARVIPNELTSLLLDCAGKHVVDDAGDDASIDELAVETGRFAADYIEANIDGNVTPIEREKLKDRARRIGSIAEKVAG